MFSVCRFGKMRKETTSSSSSSSTLSLKHLSTGHEGDESYEGPKHRGGSESSKACCLHVNVFFSPVAMRRTWKLGVIRTTEVFHSASLARFSSWKCGSIGLTWHAGHEEGGCRGSPRDEEHEGHEGLQRHVELGSVVLSQSTVEIQAPWTCSESTSCERTGSLHARKLRIYSHHPASQSSVQFE